MIDLSNPDTLNQKYEPFVNKRDGLCWEFCKEVNPQLPAQPYLGMMKIAEPIIGCVALFKTPEGWHSGIVWPDGLHFVHAKPEQEGHFIRKERLTAWPWNRALEGFYVPCK